MNKKLKILIIDRNTMRRTKLVNAFKGFADLFIWDILKEKMILLADSSIECPKPIPVDLILIHCTDAICKDVTPALLRIWYSGSSSSHPDVPKGEDQINRAVLQAGIPNEEEVNQIISYTFWRIAQPASINSSLIEGHQPDLLKNRNRETALVQLMHELYFLETTPALLRKKELPIELQNIRFYYDAFIDRLKKELEIEENQTIDPSHRQYDDLLRTFHKSMITL